VRLVVVAAAAVDPAAVPAAPNHLENPEGMLWSPF